MTNVAEDYADPEPPPWPEGKILLLLLVPIIVAVCGALVFAAWFVSGLDIGD